jgi:dienelactone hydrolase
MTAGATFAAGGDQVVEIASRGQKVRALLVKPENPVGSVVLLAGGHGNLNISPSGAIGWGRGNQVVRTRAAYAAAGYAALVLDIAPDLKQGKKAVSKYRWSLKHAADIGAAVAYMRSVAKPVYIVATSRGSLSAFNAVTRQKGDTLPDAMVVTSGMLMDFGGKRPSVQRNVAGIGDIKLPVYLIYHEKDRCSFTPSSSAARFKPLLKSAARVDIKILKGGSAGTGNPCEAKSHHGYLGIDDVVVGTVTEWLKTVAKP